MSNKFADTCWQCTHLCSSTNWRNDDVNGSRREIRCNALYYNVDPFQKKCSRFDNGHYSEDFIQRCVDAFYKKCNYYIISACVGIVDLENASAYLDAFAETKKEIDTQEVISVLRGAGVNPEHLLEEYDVYGKAVADALYAAASNPATKDATKQYITRCIVPELDEIMAKREAGKNGYAILKYILLTRKLMSTYNIEYKPEMTNPTLDETNPAVGGR